MYDGRIFHALVAIQQPENHRVRSELLLSSGGVLPVTRPASSGKGGAGGAIGSIAGTGTSTAGTSTVGGTGATGATAAGIIKKEARTPLPPSEIPTVAPTASPVGATATAIATASATIASATAIPTASANATTASVSAPTAIATVGVNKVSPRTPRALLPAKITIQDSKTAQSNKVSSVGSKAESKAGSGGGSGIVAETGAGSGTEAETQAGRAGLMTAEALPIDAFREEILNRIAKDRVTIIHGETGCGKSSRLPLFLLENSEASGCECRMMISQPRRIAASSLMKRLRSMPNVGDKVGLRMGELLFPVHYYSPPVH